MTDPKRLADIIREWVMKAENDLVNALHTLEIIEEECPTDTVCYHAQQCIEKYLKAFLVFVDIDFPKTHDISKLVMLLREKIHIDLSVEEQRRLTGYATVTRYPGDYEPISMTEARHAVSLARRVRKAIRKILPKEALRRRKK